MPRPTKGSSPARRSALRHAGTARGGVTFAVDPRIDPYFIWEENRHSMLSGEAASGPFLALLELEEGMSVREFARRIARAPPAVRDAISVSPMYHTPPRGLESSRYCSAVVGARFGKLLEHEPLLKASIRRVEYGSALPERRAPRRPSSLLDPVPQGPLRLDESWPSRDARVVVGVIDDGFAVAQGRLRDARGRARVRWFWDQAAVPAKVSPLGYGRVYDGSYVDRVVRRCTHDGAVDEDEVYRHLEADDLPREQRATCRRVAHGTHVMDLACGEDAGSGRGATASAIVAVQLPTLATRDTSGSSLAVHVVDGLRFILGRADRMRLQGGSGPTPTVVNLSYGNIAGPHDGSSVLEAAIDEMVRLRNAAAEAGRLEVVIPAGNSRQARCHAQFELPNGDTRVLPWRILPDDATASFVEIWLARSAPGVPIGRLAVRLTSPDGARSVVARQGYSARLDGDDGAALMQVIYPPSLAGAMPMVLVAVAPTIAADGPVAPSGIWRIEIVNVGPVTVDVHAWIQRDDTAPGFVQSGRQSCFDDPAYVRHDPTGRVAETDSPASCVKRAGTLNAIASGARTLVVGGYRGDTGKAAPYSGKGPCLVPATGTPRPNPDMFAVSDCSAVLKGVLAAGTRTGSVYAMNGTSVAAPQVTRYIAERMAQGRWPRAGVASRGGDELKKAGASTPPASSVPRLVQVALRRVARRDRA